LTGLHRHNLADKTVYKNRLPFEEGVDSPHTTKSDAQQRESP
jgi:hypothetical protein